MCQLSTIVKLCQHMHYLDLVRELAVQVPSWANSLAKTSNPFSPSMSFRSLRILFLKVVLMFWFRASARQVPSFSAIVACLPICSRLLARTFQRITFFSLKCSILIKHGINEIICDPDSLVQSLSILTLQQHM